MCSTPASGGDRIHNVAYRLVGDRHPEDGERGLTGLLPLLAACESLRQWVAHIGTTNLSPKKGLSYLDWDALWVMKDVSRELVDEANVKLVDVVKG
ncbi:hypothetical protein VTK56DRAFT_10162 [Thermocarpiscus australiensis]